MSTQPIGKCGIFCKACRLFILDKCKGCFDVRSKTTKCSVFRCAETKGLDSCGKCQEFPCLEHYSSDQVYARKKLLEWKKLETASKNKKNA